MSMNLQGALAYFREKNVSIHVGGGELVVRAPRGVMNAEMLETLKRHKAAFLAMTADENIDLVRHAQDEPPHFFKKITPELLPLVSLSQEEIDRIVASVPHGVANIQDIYPLAPLQEGILFHHLLENDSSGDTYLLRSVVGFDSRERLDKFLDALRAVIGRHDILRSAVYWEGLSTPVQVVHRHASLPVNELSLSADEEALPQLLAYTDPRRVRLNLQRAPILEAYIAADHETGEWLLSLLQHHMVCDHVTAELIQSEIYLLMQGRGDLLLPPIPYRNFIAQTRTVPEAGHEAYFRRLLGDVDEPTAPFGILDVQGSDGQLGETRFRLSDALSQGIRASAKQCGVTPAVLFHVAWAQVLAVCSGRDDVVFGTVLSGRLHEAESADQVVGMFINTLPIRIPVAEVSVREAVRDTYQRLSELLMHEQAPLALAQRCSAVQWPHPLFTTLLNYRHSHETDDQGSAAASTEGWDGVRLLSGDARNNYPLTMSVGDLGQAFVLTAWSVSNPYGERLARYLERTLELLVETLTEDASRPLRSLAILPEAERLQVLIEFNATQLTYPQDRLIHTLFEEQAHRQPQADAVICAGAMLSYGELNRRANQVAHRLIALGVKPDDRVAICTERSLEMVVGLLGILKAGAAYVPLDPGYPSERLAYMLKDSASIALLTQSALQESWLLPGDANLPVLILDGEEWSGQPGHDPDPQAVGVNARHAAYVIYTSGSAGQPKGVIVEHRSAVNFWHAMRETTHRDCDPHSRIGLNAAFSFDMSLKGLLQLLSGHCLVLVPQAIRASGPALLEFLASNRIDVLDSTPSQLEGMLAAGLIEFAGHRPRSVLLGGEAINRVMWAQLKNSPHIHFYNMYGPTECTVDATIGSIRETAGGPGIGRPVANTQIYILDRHRQALPIGVAGEIYIGGAGVARGYLNRPELTAERFIEDPFAAAAGARLYKTGDLGRWLPDGTLEYLGRNDFQVKIRGFRIELGEIESRLLEHAGVGEAVVIAREDEAGGKRLVAYLVAREGAKLSVAELRESLSRELAEYMVPSAFVMLPALPLTPNGKLDRKALPAPDQAAVLSREYEAPVSETEQAIAAIWQELLGLERVGRQDHFFELGGHSLMVISMIERLRLCGLGADVHMVFGAPRLSDLAERLTGTAATQDARAEVAPNLITAATTQITPELLPLTRLSQEEIDKIVAGVPGGASNIQDIYPLAPLQEGILFHHLMDGDGGGDTYLLRSVAEFDDRERLDEFLDALQVVVRRHDILRSAVFWEGLPTPLQVVHRHAPLPVTELTLSPVEAALPQLLERTSPRRIRLNLQRAPILEAFITPDHKTGEWLLAILRHHVVCDHITMALILSEVRTLLQGQGGQLPPPVPYRNFIAQTSEVPEAEHRAYFQAQLGDVDEPTAPFGILNVQGNDEAAVEANAWLSDALAQRLREAARKHGVAPAILFHVAWAQVLARCSGRDDVVFGTVLSGRLQGSKGADQVVGMFLNTLPIRIPLGQLSVAEAIQDTYRRMSELLTHEQASLVLAQQCSGVQWPQPLFTTLFNYRHSGTPAQDRDAPPAQEVAGLRPILSEDRTNYPVTMEVDDLGQDFVLTSQSIVAVDPAQLVRYMEVTVQALVDALLDEPDYPVCRLPLLSSFEREKIVAQFNATQAAYAQDLLVHGLFEEQAATRPDAVALVFGDESLSYGELNRRANQVAHRLLGLGVKPDDRVAICTERSLEMIIGLLGIMKAGAAYVPLDPVYPTDRLAYMLEDCAAAALLTQAGLHARLPALQLAAMPVVMLEDAYLAAQPGHNPDSQALGLSSHHMAYVIYTSGSTGQPKGVMVEHRHVLSLICAHVAMCGLKPGRRVMQFASYSFDNSVAEIFPALSVGMTIVLRPADLVAPDETFTAFLQAHDIDIVDLPTAFWHQWSQEIRSGRSLPGPGLKLVVVGGEKLERPYLKHWLTEPTTRDCGLLNTYGPTEATVNAIAIRLDSLSLLEADEVPIGRPIPNTRIYILDRHGQPVPIGVAGEIHIGGTSVARGYLNRPELTAERFIEDPFAATADARLYKTGDLGRWLPDGTVEYLGRNDFQVKIRGFRIELGEVESRLLGCAGVREAVVVVREDAEGDKRLVAYVVAQEGGELSVAELRESLLRELAEYMVPSAFVMLPALPLTPNGKLDRKALPAPDQAAVLSRVYEAPANETERTIAVIWQELLGLERVGRHDHFFELGGHSLMAIKFMHRLSSAFGRSLPLATIFSNPTVGALAAVVEGRQRPESLVVPLQVDGKGRPLFCIHPVGGQISFYQALAKHLGRTIPTYGIQSPEVIGLPMEFDSAEAMAEAYGKAIREVQPAGPYRLLGWSTGGLIAAAIAKYLAENDGEVEYLGLIDTYSTFSDEEPTREHFLAEAALIEMRGSGIELSEAWTGKSSFETMAVEEILGMEFSVAAAYLEKLTRSKLSVESFEHLKSQVPVTARHLKILSKFQPNPTEAPLQVFQAGRSSATESFDDFLRHQKDLPAWIRTADAHWIEADHYSLLGEPHAELIGEAVLTFLIDGKRQGE